MCEIDKTTSKGNMNQFISESTVAAKSTISDIPAAIDMSPNELAMSIYPISTYLMGLQYCMCVIKQWTVVRGLLLDLYSNSLHKTN